MDTEKLQRAIDTLKSLCSVIYGSRAHVNITAEQGVDFETALACMEKQVPKAVVDGHYDRSNDCYYGKCPECGKEIYDYANDKFCGECCQALDWESETEK
jgi:hypothetical protein